MITASETRFSELILGINEALAEGKYADPTSFGMRQIKRECEKVRDADPATGWGLLGSYYSVVGDVDEAERSFGASVRLATIPVVIDNYLSHLVNHGFFSMAHELFLEHAHPKTGQFSALAQNGFAVGAIQSFVTYYELAKAMRQELPQLPVETARVASAVLERAGISDEHVARHLDAVGRVLRRHKLFIDDLPHVTATDREGVFSGVTYIFKLKCTAEQAFEYNLELASEEEEMGIEKKPAFDAIFLAI